MGCLELELGITAFADLSGPESFQEGYADPEGAVARLEDADARFAATVAGVTNPDVQVAAARAADGMHAYVAAVSEIVADPEHADLTALGEQATELGAAFAAVGEYCDV
ncbi:hypothetical protein [Agromyces sp. SYSU T0242]|uniref:hypothetical protein n=1 Tax=Agromyces litoreus TaxID=3158561 RepID=UPI0033908A12